MKTIIDLSENKCAIIEYGYVQKNYADEPDSDGKVLFKQSIIQVMIIANPRYESANLQLLSGNDITLIYDAVNEIKQMPEIKNFPEYY